MTAATTEHATGTRARLALIRAAGWTVEDFIVAVAREQGCECASPILTRGGFGQHDHGCRYRGHTLRLLPGPTSRVLGDLRELADMRAARRGPDRAGAR